MKQQTLTNMYPYIYLNLMRTVASIILFLMDHCATKYSLNYIKLFYFLN